MIAPDFASSAAILCFVDGLALLERGQARVDLRVGDRHGDRRGGLLGCRGGRRRRIRSGRRRGRRRVSGRRRGRRCGRRRTHSHRARRVNERIQILLERRRCRCRAAATSCRTRRRSSCPGRRARRDDVVLDAVPGRERMDVPRLGGRGGRQRDAAASPRAATRARSVVRRRMRFLSRPLGPNGGAAGGRTVDGPVDSSGTGREMRNLRTDLLAHETTVNGLPFRRGPRHPDIRSDEGESHRDPGSSTASIACPPGCARPGAR
jgi:hypothetical protein